MSRRDRRVLEVVVPDQPQLGDLTEQQPRGLRRGVHPELVTLAISDGLVGHFDPDREHFQLVHRVHQSKNPCMRTHWSSSFVPIMTRALLHKSATRQWSVHAGQAHTGCAKLGFPVRAVPVRRSAHTVLVGGERVTGHTNPPYLRRRLGRRLQHLREKAGMTLDEAAPKLDKTRSSLNRIETGETRADVHLIRSMMDLYDHLEGDLLDLS